MHRQYSKLIRPFIQSRPLCEIKSPVCTVRTQGAHHPAGRDGDKLLKLEECFASCNACNSYVEAHDQWARERGFKKSRLTNAIESF